MTKEEVEAVLAHGVAHVANGDMVTLTLIQGVVNTFVIFLSRVVGYVVDKAIFKTERGTGPGYFITVIVCQIVFGILASIIVAWFSRRREFGADAGAAQFMGTPRPMVAALRRLGGLDPGGTSKGIPGLRDFRQAWFHGTFFHASAHRRTHRCPRIARVTAGTCTGFIVAVCDARSDYAGSRLKFGVRRGAYPAAHCPLLPLSRTGA